MTDDDPLRLLLEQALDLMHPAFLAGDDPAAAAREFYHQFRKLWDRGIPVGMGLGHLAVRPADGYDFAIHRLGEGGRADEPLAALAFGRVPPPADGFPLTLAVLFTAGRWAATGI